MSNLPNSEDRRALLSAALQKIQEMQDRLSAMERAQKEPIAIIGMGCRFPGSADCPERFWTMLHEGVNAVREVPADRWDVDAYYDPDPEAPGKTYTRFGGFLNQIDQFDPQFFGISPREALTIDPQQRLVLEVGWEALEDAGHASLAKLRGSRTGVFIGVGSSDYGQILLGGAIENIDAYTGSGAGPCFTAGRFSYCLGLQGPSLSVDTACSSSLVAVHLACQSLRAGECAMAVAGGVNIIAKPEVFVYLSRVKALAADGRCKTFDAKADGFVRAEGCGIIVLKRLSDALADGDNILALIRGSAVNQDGASGGLTVPNGPAQQALIGEALTRGGIEPADVDYVEAHGTGTSLGDPIEVGALVGALGRGRPSTRPLTIASVKTNLGHLEAAAGIAGLIKVVLSLRNSEIPQHLHFEKLNPAISFGEVQVVIPTERRPWPAGSRSRIGSVSSFGLSGTNAHVVIQEAPAAAPLAVTVDRPLHVLALSARSPIALRELAGKLSRHLEIHPELSLRDVCFTANTGRSHFGHRLAITASTIEQLRARLTGFGANELDGVLYGSVELTRRPKIAFLFTGQGSQYSEMGKKLYETQPTFRRTIDRVAELLRDEMDRPLLEVLFPETGDSLTINETGYAQPALFAIEYALSDLWRSWGIEPSVVLGHSIGEYAAACASGVMTLESAVRLVAARGRLMQSLPRGGAMAAVAADLTTIMEAIKKFGAGRVSLAAQNAPSSYVVSGEASAVKKVTAALAAQGSRINPLSVSHAFHSDLMEPILREFEVVARTVDYAAPKIPWISTLTGETVHGAVDAQYWTRQIRESVRLSDAFSTLRAREIQLGIEIGPTPVLLGLARECGISKQGWVGTLRRGRNDWNEILTSLGTLYIHGAAVDWNGVDRDYTRRRVALPTYPFQRQRFWCDAIASAATHSAHPLRSTEAPKLPMQQREPSDLFYEERWERKPSGSSAIAPNSGNRPRGTWLIVAFDGGAGAELSETLRARGESVVVARPGATWHRDSENHVTLNPERLEDCRRLLSEYSRGQTLRGLVLVGPGIDAKIPFDPAFCRVVVHLAKAIGDMPDNAPQRVWLVTSGAQKVLPMQVPSLSQAPLVGLVRSLALEQPALGWVSVDLDPEAVTPGGVAAFGDELLANQDEGEIAFRQGVRFVRRLGRPSIPPADIKPVRIRSDATYLITGGFGALGLIMARWMVEQGARHLVLVGRAGPRGKGAEKVAEFERLGVSVRIACADVANEAQMKTLFSEMAQSMPPLAGLIHSAGVIEDGLVGDLSWESFERVFAPKIRGAWTLHILTEKLKLDFFVMFSSAASFFGSAGQANYSAANAFLDALAGYRHLLDLPGLSVNWGPWEGDGMAAGVSDMHRRRWQGLGTTPIDAKTGTDALGHALASRNSQIAIVPINWAALKDGGGTTSLRKLAASFINTATPGFVSRSKKITRSALLALQGVERAKLLADYISVTVSTIMGIKHDELKLDQGLTELGFDSLMVLELRNQLELDLASRVSMARLLNNQSVADLANLVSETIIQAEAAETSEDGGMLAIATRETEEGEL